MHRKGGGGATDAYHTTDELHRIPEGLCDDVVQATLLALYRPSTTPW